jgi:hypothetical protein
MPKKAKETEVELDEVKQGKKKDTFTTRWFQDYCVNNTREMKIVCDLTARNAAEQFNMYISSGNTEVFAVIFYAAFTSILDFIRGKQKTYNNFTIQIAQTLNLGYTNNDDEENEKVGNFMPIMEHIDATNMKVIRDERLESNTTEIMFQKWRQVNDKKNIDYYKEIQENAMKRLQQDYHTQLRTSEAIIPLFCIFLDNIVAVLKESFRELEGTDTSEVSMNVLGLFDVYYSYSEEDAKEIIEFEPNIMMKLALKNDENASRE